MAKAIAEITKSEVQVTVTVTLSEDEAVSLRNELGGLNTLNGKYEIYTALNHALGDV